MSVVKSKRVKTRRHQAAKAKPRKGKSGKYGHYDSYREYSESIIMQPARELFELLDKRERKAD